MLKIIGILGRVMKPYKFVFLLDAYQRRKTYHKKIVKKLFTQTSAID